MKLYEYVIRVKDQFSDKFQRLTRAAGVSENKVEGVRRKLHQVDGEARTLNSTFGTLGRTLAGVFAFTAITAFVTDLKATTARFDSLERSINFASGSAAEGAKNMKFLYDITDRMGLPLLESIEGFKTLAGNMIGTRLQGEGTRKIFEGVSAGVVAMGLSADQAKGAYLALGQMMGKGKVQAEELRGQLAERIPGAFDAAARAMGVTTAELNKMMDDGKLISEDFLPKFAEEMKRTFGGALPDAALSLTANTNRMNKQWLQTKIFLGDQLMPIFQKSVILLAQLAKGVRENWSFIKDLGIAVGIAAGAWGVYNAALMANAGLVALSAVRISGLTIAQFASFVATNGLTGAVMGLNAALAILNVVNPLAWVVALGAALVWAYYKVDWFRGGVIGLYEAFKETFSKIGDVAKQIFGGVYDIIAGLFDWDIERAKSGFLKLADGIISATPVGFAVKYGKDIAGAYAKGYNDELASNMPKMNGFAIAETNKPFSEAFGGPWAQSKAERSAINSGSSVTSDTDTDTSKGINSIAGGGGRVMNVNVSVGKFMDKIEIHSSVAESADEIEATVKQLFTRIINGGIYSATQ